MMTLHKTVISAVILLSLSLGACSGKSQRSGVDSGYRTVATEPRRDTDAAKRYNTMGLGYMDDGDIDRAEKAFTDALTADIEFGPAHNNLGKVYYRRQDWYRAAWEFEYAGKLLPRHAEPRNNLALVLERAGELDRAVDAYREAVTLDPESIEYRGNLVRALVRRGDGTDEVRSLLAELLEKDTRADWIVWARQQMVKLNSAPGR